MVFPRPVPRSCFIERMQAIPRDVESMRRSRGVKNGEDSFNRRHKTEEDYTLLALSWSLLLRHACMRDATDHPRLRFEREKSLSAPPGGGAAWPAGVYRSWSDLVVRGTPRPRRRPVYASDLIRCSARTTPR